MRRRTSARFFPKKECCVRLNVGEGPAASNVCDGLGSLKANLSSKKPFGRTPSGFVFQTAFEVLQKNGFNVLLGNEPLLLYLLYFQAALDVEAA